MTEQQAEDLVEKALRDGLAHRYDAVEDQLTPAERWVRRKLDAEAHLTDEEHQTYEASPLCKIDDALLRIGEREHAAYAASPAAKREAAERAVREVEDKRLSEKNAKEQRFITLVLVAVAELVIGVALGTPRDYDHAPLTARRRWCARSKSPCQSPSTTDGARPRQCSRRPPRRPIQPPASPNKAIKRRVST